MMFCHHSQVPKGAWRFGLGVVGNYSEVKQNSVSISVCQDKTRKLSVGISLRSDTTIDLSIDRSAMIHGSWLKAHASGPAGPALCTLLCPAPLLLYSPLLFCSLYSVHCTRYPAHGTHGSVLHCLWFVMRVTLGSLRCSVLRLLRYVVETLRFATKTVC